MAKNDILPVMRSISLYLHIPFCIHRCGYCDFNTYAGMEKFIPAYVEALCREISVVAAASPEPMAARTIYFGGGTPSLLKPEHVERILQTIKDNFNLSQLVETTLEANPGTVTLDQLRAFRSAGINRISLGMQTTRADELRMLERIHSHRDVIEAVQAARTAGFDNISLDLIFGLPGQTLASWQESLEAALALKPEHLSLYSLTVEEGTPLFKQVETGSVPTPDDDTAADHYQLAMEMLPENGYAQYEISNFAIQRNGHLLASQHNLTYWRNQPYLGFGAGAHGYAAHTRTANINPIPAYLNRMKQPSDCTFPVSPAAEEITKVDSWQAMQETLMLGLRLTDEGVSNATFEERFERSLLNVFPNQIEKLTRQGLLEWNNDNLRLTPHGRFLGNQVFLEFVGNPPE
ncbi:MAG: radical SAM family heme chaperone HemW [Anaerolineaceae bacterium]|nr:radical SAM family heme chaperone HemW [Anaerolineaceae bacterium]